MAVRGRLYVWLGHRKLPRCQLIKGGKKTSGPGYVSTYIDFYVGRGTKVQHRQTIPNWLARLLRWQEGGEDAAR